ncbi:low molecular weight protein arginine phosphatase [Paenibacillus puldeungensis]|uniref:Low molecular weight protein arginine phosphatase n=1 Tax=Paenibacillus puldeungensis TaxID=696536 RepID=A0ABW3S564_9BACL
MRILFVCTGNTCRSPMAEGMLRKMARERSLDIEVRSAGVAAMDGMAISRHAEAVLRDFGVIDPIVSKQLYAELTEWADLILTLTQGHKRQVVHTFPEAAEKIYTLKEFVEDDKTVVAEREELQRLIADRELNKVLGREWTAAEEERLNVLRQRMPVHDISDPFGGSREDYNRTAAEIRTSLEKLLDKLKDGPYSV